VCERLTVLHMRMPLPDQLSGRSAPGAWDVKLLASGRSLP
jgi:hypothetical protein